MKEFVIVTDSCSDLHMDYVEKNNIEYVPLTYQLGDQEYIDDFGKTMTHKEFYHAMKEGSIVKTSQPSPQSFYDVFYKHVKKGTEVLYIGVSTGLSGTFNSASLAKRMVLEKKPNAGITLINTLTASIGQGLLVMQAVEMKRQQKPLSEIVEYLEIKRNTMRTFMSVNDLKYLKIGGRISRLQYSMGMLLNINIMLCLDKEGKVGLLDKVRGRKKAILHFVKSVKENIINPENQVIAISHGEAFNDALALKEEILKEVKVREVVLGNIGPVVGAYGGPGALAVFFTN
ncbi:DegV family protein [Desulfofalx alkaliphila]|uniref:DegV family protein n=1 Tax=Desulfofalx alkaliphila TaxID=105483 RepID=UPI0004E18D25|nr:DegV family protein [Desulfofalx alkaliphila]